MGAFKLDLMTLLVIFVVISVIFTMTSGKNEEKSAVPATAVEKPIVQGMNHDVKAADFSTANFRQMSPRVTRSKFAPKTWN